MSNYNAIKTATDANIKANGRKEITGPVLNAVLNAIIDSLGKYYQFVGLANPSLNPGTPDQNVAYFAISEGTYEHFGGLTVGYGELTILVYDGEWRKATVKVIPDKTSQLSNDTGFVTNAVNDLINYYTRSETYTKAEVDQMIAAIKQFRFELVNTLPTASADTMYIIYLVPSTDPATGDVKDEYITIENGGVYSWEKIGRTTIDLSNYPTRSEMTTAINNALAAYITGVSATVDNNTGIPSVDVSFSNGTIHLAFHNLKGAQGNTGSSVDYPFTLVNNVTTDDATQALTAAMGKYLQDELGQLEAKVDDLDEELGDTGFVIERPPVTFTSGYINYSDGQKTSSSVNSASDAIDVEGFESVEYLANSTTTASSTASAAFYDANGVHISSILLPIESTQEERVLVADVPANAKTFRYTVRTQYLADTYVKLTKGKSVGEQLNDIYPQLEDLSGQEEEYVGFNLLNPATSVPGYLDHNNGKVIPSTSGILTTDFIAVNGQGIYAYPAVQYGPPDGGLCVYDENKVFLRTIATPVKDYSYQSGDAYIRFTYYSNTGYQVACYKPQENISGVFSPTYDKQTIVPFGGEQVFGQDNIPVAKPAISSVGKDGASTTVATLDGTSATDDGKRLILSAWPSFIKNGQTVCARGKFTTVGEIRVGFNCHNNLGYFVRLTSSEMSICRFNGDNTDNYIVVVSENHGLSIASYFDIRFTKTADSYKVSVMTEGGTFVKDGDFSQVLEGYGKPFVEAFGTTVITDVTLRAVSDRFRKSVWVVGDSYVSMYAKRWPYQLIYTYGEKDFLLDGLAGGTSARMYTELESMFNYGIPKYLVWCVGMNDTSWNWKYYEKKVEMLCRANGVTLILSTIPWPTGGNKSYINDAVRDSGYRYIDVYGAVSSDLNGTWYTGYNDDGDHPTELGAKAIASQVLVDFPEITQ